MCIPRPTKWQNPSTTLSLSCNLVFLINEEAVYPQHGVTWLTDANILLKSFLALCISGLSAAASSFAFLLEVSTVTYRSLFSLSLFALKESMNEGSGAGRNSYGRLPSGGEPSYGQNYSLDCTQQWTNDGVCRHAHTLRHSLLSVFNYEVSAL